MRLAFEYAGESYSEMLSPATLLSTITDPAKVGHPPHLAPPALELPSGRFLSQTPAILNYLAPRFKLAGERGSRVLERDLSDDEREQAEEERAVVNQLTLTALDLCNETHDVHHPIAVALYYEDQKEEALRRAEDFRKNRIPKFFKHFESVLQSNPATEKGSKTYLVGRQTTTADLTLFHVRPPTGPCQCCARADCRLQVVDGLLFAFPSRLAALKKSGEYDNVFALHERVKGEKGIKEYIASGRRQAFSMGLFRHYEELDGDE